jgi:hypothetical protein
MSTPEVLLDSDFFRADARALADGRPYKEWHHFVVHDGRFRLIVNFSLTDRDGEAVHRVIALARHDEWSATVDEFAATDCMVRTGRVVARFGPCEFALVEGAYDLIIQLPAIGVRGRVRLVPVSIPFVVNNQRLAAGARISWLFVPRLEAYGHVWIGDTRVSLRGAPAYHDHNWGRFRWGDNFGWEWGSVLPRNLDDPWTVVCQRMTDRHRRRATRQAMYVWHGQEPVALWCDAAVRFEHQGFLRRAPETTVPAVMRVLRPNTASDVPARLTIEGRGNDRIAMQFEPEEYVRIVVPDEVDPMGVVVLNEVSGRITARGEVAGRAMDVEASGVFELLH